jgi:hypothetical protein
MNKSRVLPGIIGIVAFTAMVKVIAPGLFLPAIIGMVLLTIIVVVMMPAFRKGPEAATIRGFIAGMVTGGIGIGLIGYATADPGWKDLQTIATAAMSVVGGGGAGAVLGWVLGRYFGPDNLAPDSPLCYQALSTASKCPCHLWVDEMIIVPL